MKFRFANVLFVLKQLRVVCVETMAFIYLLLFCIYLNNIIRGAATTTAFSPIDNSQRLLDTGFYAQTLLNCTTTLLMLREYYQCNTIFVRIGQKSSIYLFKMLSRICCICNSCVHVLLLLPDPGLYQI